MLSWTFVPRKHIEEDTLSRDVNRKFLHSSVFGLIKDSVKLHAPCILAQLNIDLVIITNSLVLCFLCCNITLSNRYGNEVVILVRQLRANELSAWYRARSSSNHPPTDSICKSTQ